MAKRYRIPKSVIARDRERSKRYSENTDSARNAVLAGYTSECKEAIIEAAKMHMTATQELELAKEYYTVQPNGVKRWKHEYACEYYKKVMAEVEAQYREYLTAKEQISATYGIHTDKVAELVRAVVNATNSVKW